MRHRKLSRKIGRTTSGKKALLRGLVSNLLINERIKTTYVKAKEASSLADRIIRLGKINTPTSKKTAISILGSKVLINKLFNDIAPRFAARHGGYTRVLLVAPRKGDGAKMALLELTERKAAEKAEAKKAKKERKETKKALPKEVVGKKEKPAPEEEKHPSAIQPKAVTKQTKEKLEEEKEKEHAKSKEERLRKGFFKGLRHYFRRKSF